MNVNSMNVSGRRAFIFCLVLAALFMHEPQQCQAQDKLNIVTTTTNLKSIAEAVGGEHVNVSSIASGGEDPHFIQAKPSYMLRAKNADLWIRVGLDLEIGYERLILEGSRNPRIHIGSPGHLDASAGVIPLDVPTQKVSRSMGDVHPLGNPHYWLDPYNGRIIARNICRRLKELDPVHAEEYDRNVATFVLKLDSAMFGSEVTAAVGGEQLWKMQSNGTLEKFINDYNDKVMKAKQSDPQTEQQMLLLDGWLAKLKPFEHSKIVTYHRSWPYFAHRFGLDVVAELEPKPGIPPGPGHVVQVINTMKSEKARVILMEPFYDRRDAEAVAKKAETKVVVAAAAVRGQKEAADYIAVFDNVVSRLSGALSEVSK